MNLNVNNASNCNDEFFGGSSTTPEITGSFDEDEKYQQDLWRDEGVAK